MSLNWEAVPGADGVTGAPVPHWVIWLDPSAPSGYACWRPKSETFTSGELPFYELGEWLTGMLFSNAWVGWEAYVIRPGSGRIKQDGSSLQVIGMASWISHTASSRVLKPQQPDDRVLGLKHLHAVGWHNPGKADADDAAAHLLAFLLKWRLLPPRLVNAITSSLSGEKS